MNIEITISADALKGNRDLDTARNTISSYREVVARAAEFGIVDVHIAEIQLSTDDDWGYMTVQFRRTFTE